MPRCDKMGLEAIQRLPSGAEEHKLVNIENGTYCRPV